MRISNLLGHESRRVRDCSLTFRYILDEQEEQEGKEFLDEILKRWMDFYLISESVAESPWGFEILEKT